MRVLYTDEIHDLPDRPARTAAAVFSRVRGGMGRRGRFRKTGRRTPSGRLSQAAHEAEHNPYLAYQRLRMLDPEMAEQFLKIVCRPAAARSKEEQAIVVVSTNRAHNPNLGYLPGLAFERGLFRNTDGAGEVHDGRELLQAADIYARLHRQVWGKLSADIEKALGPDDVELLLEVGRVTAPAPPVSHFRVFVAGTPAAADDPDPEQYLRRRLKLADRHAAARACLMQFGLASLLIVETVVIEGITPSFLRPGEARNTAIARRDQQNFVGGLRALAEHFGLFERGKERGGIRTERFEELAPLKAGGER